MLPPIIGGLHCGSRGEFAALFGGLEVLPPIIGGLHCGFSDDWVCKTGWAVLPPIIGGLHCGLLPAYRELAQYSGAPADDRRAPLRPSSMSARHGSLRVLPPIIGGLHCGGRGLQS